MLLFFTARVPNPQTPKHAQKNRCAANSLLARAGVAPSRTCVRRGGALQVLGDAPGVRVIERPGLVAALVSSAVTEARFVAAYEAALATESSSDDSGPASLSLAPTVPDSNASRRRVCALKKALGDLHAEDGAFAVVAFDVAAGRVLAARTANAAPLHYGFTQDGALVASGGLTAARLFPDAGDAALRLTPLPSGRFVFGHRFVKPIEFTRFWDTAASNRAAAPARDACPDAYEQIGTVFRAAAGADAAAEGARRRWAATGSVGDGESRWNATGKTARTAPPSPSPLKMASAGAYAPPALRKAREAAAVAAAAAAAAVERDAQVAKALAAQDAVVSSLGDALAAAVAARAPAARSSLRRAGLRSSTFTLGRVPGAGAEAKKLGLSGLGKLRTSSFRAETADPKRDARNAAPRTCAEAEAGFASFKANFERLASARGSRVAA